MEGEAEGSLFDFVDLELLWGGEGGDEVQRVVLFELLVRDGECGNRRLRNDVACHVAIAAALVVIIVEMNMSITLLRQKGNQYTFSFVDGKDVV